MSRLYNYCLLRWTQGAWTEAELNIAVSKVYITEDEKVLIMTYHQQDYNSLSPSAQ